MKTYEKKFREAFPECDKEKDEKRYYLKLTIWMKFCGDRELYKEYMKDKLKIKREVKGGIYPKEN